VTALLEAVDLHTFYGASHVLYGVSLSIAPGQTVSLMGRNGMGKTTTIRSLLRLTPPRSGEIRVRGQRATDWPAHRIAAQGIALVPEGRGIFPTLTVRENLVVAQRPGFWTMDRALALFPRLRERTLHLGSQLSGGEQQMLSIARALLTNPQLIILDGATEGLAPLVRQEIWSAIRKLKAEGVAALIVEQNAPTALAVSDRVYVMDRGTIVHAGPAHELRDDAARRRRLLGV